MGYQTSGLGPVGGQEWVPSTDIAAPAITATSGGSTPVGETGANTTARATVTVSAASGTLPTLDLYLMTCRTATGTFRQVAKFPQFVTTGTADLSVGGLDRYIRLDYVVGGTTPSFTFTISGELI
jgi:hypothetical protein